MPLPQKLSGSLELRRNQIERVQEYAGGVFDNNFRLDVTGLGDALVQIDFTVRFVEQPLCLDGWALKPNQRLIAGAYPAINAGVFVWHFVKHADTGYPFYDGATIAISATNGPPGMLSTVFLSFRGKALRNPAGR